MSLYLELVLNEYLAESRENLVVPEIAVHLAEGGEGRGKGVSLGSRDSFPGPPSGARSRDSVSTFASAFSSMSEFSNDLDLQSIQAHLAETTAPEQGLRFRKIRGLLRRHSHSRGSDNSDNGDFGDADSENQVVLDLCLRLSRNYYHYEKGRGIEFDWEAAAETFLFGDRICNVLPTDASLLSFLGASSYELGEPRFSNLEGFHKTPLFSTKQFLDEARPQIDALEDILALYLDSKNIWRPELFQKFSDFAQRLNPCLPLAVAMFGEWLLLYNRDETVESNFENALIVNYFRKAARLALVIRKLKVAFAEAVQNEPLASKRQLEKFWGKDNTAALSISLHSLGEFYQFRQEYHVLVTLYELSCHLTGDVNDGNLAIMGLGDGFGLGNHVKKLTRSKTDKYNTKRRIAHLYRVMRKQPGFHEYNISWVDKLKYD